VANGGDHSLRHGAAEAAPSIRFSATITAP
jgi:hypothetical protein